MMLRAKLYFLIGCILYPFATTYRRLFPYRATVTIGGSDAARATAALEAMVIAVRHDVQVKFDTGGKWGRPEIFGMTVTFSGPDVSAVRAARRDLSNWRYK